MGHGVVGLGSTGSIGSTAELSVLPHPVAHSCAAQTSKASDRVRGDRRVLGDRSEGTLLAHQAHRKRRIARYQMLCRVTHSADRAFEFAMLSMERAGLHGRAQNAGSRRVPLHRSATCETGTRRSRRGPRHPQDSHPCAGSRHQMARTLRPRSRNSTNWFPATRTCVGRSDRSSARATTYHASG